MHSMPNTTEVTAPTTIEIPTFGPPRVVARKPRMDAALADASELARDGIKDFTPAEEIGEYLGVHADDERLVTHRFVSHVPGYSGWELFATLARAPRSKVITICETGMLPGEGAILAPAWVPWMERASEEERIRLDAIAAGEDPAKALEAAGFGPREEAPVEQPEVVVKDEEPVDETTQRKRARREAKRRRAKQKAARRQQQKPAQPADDKK